MSNYWKMDILCLSKSPSKRQWSPKWLGQFSGWIYCHNLFYLSRLWKGILDKFMSTSWYQGHCHRALQHYLQQQRFILVMNSIHFTSDVVVKIPRHQSQKKLMLSNAVADARIKISAAQNSSCRLHFQKQGSSHGIAAAKNQPCTVPDAWACLWSSKWEHSDWREAAVSV